MGCSSSRSAPAWVLPTWLQYFRNRLLQRGSPMGSQALPANLLRRGLLSPRVCRSWQEPAPAWGYPWGHSFLRASPCSSVGSLPRATHGDLLHCGPPWAAGASPQSSPGAAGQSLPGAPPPPPSAQTLVSAELFLSLSLTPLSVLLQWFSLLKHPIPEALPPSLMGLALTSVRSALEPAGVGSIRHGGRFWQLLTEDTPIPAFHPPCHANPLHQCCESHRSQLSLRTVLRLGPPIPITGFSR